MKIKIIKLFYSKKEKNTSVNFGYWRSHSYNLNIYKCLNKLKTCLGGYSSKCLDGYTGPLCEVCVKKNNKIAEKNSSGKCKVCDKTGLTFLFLTLILFACFILIKILSPFFLSNSKQFTKVFF